MMIKQHFVRQLLPLFVFCLLLFGCSQENSTPPEIVRSDATPTTAAAIAESVDIVTETPPPSPTSTQTPTALPPTATQPPPTPTAVLNTPTPAPLLAPQVDPEIAAWLQENVVPIDTAVPSDSYEDLMPLAEMIGDSRIVLLGEATHGTREFFQMKHRLVQFLVQEMDFNIFAMEASWVNSLAVNSYIQTNSSSAEEVVEGMGYWTWDTQEVVDMVSWMRQYNEEADNANALQFAGFDPQLHEPAVEQIIAYLEEVDPEARPELIPNLQCFRRIDIYLERTEAEQDSCQANLQSVYDFLAAQEASYVAQSSEAEFATVLQAASILQQASALYGTPFEEWSDIRDRFMAANVAWLLEQAGPEAKIVLWAHNEHVSKLPESGSMASFLQEQFGDEVTSIGLLTHRGTFNAIDYTREENGIRQFTAVPAPPQTFDDILRSSGQPRFLLDLRQPPANSSVAELLNTPQHQRTVGASYSLNCPQTYFLSAPPSQRFDLVVYLEETTGAQSINWRTIPDMAAANEFSLRPDNLDFEEGAVCWVQDPQSVADYLLRYPTDEGVNDSRTLFVSSRGDTKEGKETLISQALSAGGFQGQQVRLTAEFRSSGVSEGAGLLMNTAVGYRVVRSETAVSDLVTGDTEWTTVELLVDVPENATRLSFSIFLRGNGELWVDNFSLSVVGPSTN